MEGITRLVSESLARHGFDRPLDYRRLHWSRWFRCESHHSLLSVPSKPGVFALAEEVMNLGSATPHVGADALVRPAERRSSAVSSETTSAASTNREGHDFSRAVNAQKGIVALAAAGNRGEKANADSSRMLAVTQFFDADDMAFVLDRMLSRENPMRARLATGRYFVRYVSIDEESQRRSICSALNQWIANSGEKVSGIGTHFATSDLSTTTARVGTATADSANAHVGTDAFVRPASEASSLGTGLGFPAATSSQTAPNLDSGAASNLHCPHPLPSGF